MMGWELCWGNACSVGVPLSPWLTALISIVLGLASFVAIKRYSKGIAILISGAVIVGGVAGYEMQKAQATRAGFEIDQSNGTRTYTCGSEFFFGVENTSGASITVFVRPFGGVYTGNTFNYSDQDCRNLPGNILQDADICFLPCKEGILG